MRKILSLFFALLMASMMQAKVAFLVPADNTNKESMRYETVVYYEGENRIIGEEQSPERRAWQWFNDNFVTSGDGQFICFNDLNDIPSDIHAIWIYVDRVEFSAGDFDNLFNATVKANLQTFLNAGGNLFLCKQATRLEKDLVGATDGQSDEAGSGNVIVPDYNDGGYVNPATWAVDYKFYNEWASNGGHRMFASAPHRNDNEAELIWTNGRKLTNNNCGIGTGAMGMNDIWDGNDHLVKFQTRNNCKVLGTWANGDGCHYGGVIEFYPTGTRKGTVIMFGLAAYQWINNNAGNGWENTQEITKGALEYLNARPCALGNTTPMEEKLADDYFYPSNTTTFRTLHSLCEDMAAAYSIVSDPNGIARIHEGKLQFKAAGTVTLHITLTENREFKNWPKGTYEYDREITFAYADAQAAQDGPNFTWPSQFETGAVGPNSVITLPATVAELPVSYEVIGDASLEDNEMTLANVESGSVTVNASVTETGYHEAWPAGVYNYQNSLTFHAAEVGYLLPAAESIDHLKFSDDPNYQGQQPEYNAAKWFQDNYIATGQGRFVTVDELPTLKAKGIKALWVNIERVNIDNVNGLLTACLADDGLKTYIQAGGNVLLTKQATRLAYTMGRIGYEPAFNAGEYFEPTNPGESRSISTRMGTDNEVDEVLDMSGHRLFADMLSWDDAKHVFLVGENCWQTNNYCSWQDFMRKEGEETHYDNKKIQRVRDFEQDWHATVFGIHGDVTDYCYSNVVEFNAIENEWAGRILAIGATGYQWGSANPTTELDNVKKLTANSLSYLLDEPLADEVYTRNGLTPGIYGTICFDYAVEAGHIEGAEIYELTSFNATNDGVILTQVDAMVAGRPYFFLATANELRLTYHGQRVAAGSYHGLVGHIGETTLHITPNDNNYILYNNELLLVNTDDIELPSYRAYINKYDEIPAYSEPTSNAPRRIMAIEPPHNAPTVVEAVDMQAAQGVYDIMGRKLSAPQGNGFYIINGQKVIITQ